MKVAETSIKYSILINLLVVAIVIMGIVSIIRMPREEFPAVEFGRVVVVVPYPGVSPEEIEQLVTNKIETALSGLPNLDVIESSSEESRATISVSFDTGVDSEEAYDLVSREMSKVNDLPEGTLDPIIIRLSMRELNPISQVVISGDYSPLALRELAEELKNGILKIDNVSKVEIVGARDHRSGWMSIRRELTPMDSAFPIFPELCKAATSISPAEPPSMANPSFWCALWDSSAVSTRLAT